MVTTPIAMSQSELQARASRLRLVISDVDGVLTDGGVYYSSQGEEMKRFSVRDGMGVERLRIDGVDTALLTRESSAIVSKRALKLQVRLVYQGVGDKGAFLTKILDDAGVQLDQVGYIGDDTNDAAIMQAIASAGLVAAPSDARPEIRALAHHRSAAPGGCGAFRDFAEWLLDLRAAARVPRATNGHRDLNDTARPPMNDD
ncbi:MAG: 3-deoxy-D-manno-octulosonate 8-phosphate phosphatase [Pseudomonadota bacterium]